MQPQNAGGNHSVNHPEDIWNKRFLIGFLLLYIAVVLSITIVPSNKITDAVFSRIDRAELISVLSIGASGVSILESVRKRHHQINRRLASLEEDINSTRSSVERVGADVRPMRDELGRVDLNVKFIAQSQHRLQDGLDVLSQEAKEIDDKVSQSLELITKGTSRILKKILLAFAISECWLLCLFALQTIIIALILVILMF